MALRGLRGERVLIASQLIVVIAIVIVRPRDPVWLIRALEKGPTKAGGSLAADESALAGREGPTRTNVQFGGANSLEISYHHLEPPVIDGPRLLLSAQANHEPCSSFSL